MAGSRRRSSTLAGMTPEGHASAPVRVGLLGCGNVGGALAEVLAEDPEGLFARTGLRLELTRVAVRNTAKARGPSVPEHLLTSDAAAVVTADDVDVVVELIGGIEPARSLILDALKAGKPVVTGNKELVADLGDELFQAAAAAGVDLLFEAAVAGGIPIVRPLRESLAGERLTRVMGIVNGTTNYILTKMEAGESYGEALAEAQSLGYAERDPTADVEGFDASAKAAIIATLAFGQKVVGGDVAREGISGLTPADFAFARRMGFVVKLLAVAECHGDGSVSARVHPSLVAADHPLASVRGSFNAVFVEGEAVGQLMFFGRGAGAGRRPAPSSATCSTPPTRCAAVRAAACPSRAGPGSAPSRTWPRPTTSACWCATSRVCSPPWPVPLAATASASARWSRRGRRGATPGSTSSPTPPPSATCRPP